MADAAAAPWPLRRALFLVVLVASQLRVYHAFLSSKTRLSAASSTRRHANPAISGGDDDDVTYLSEEKLRAFWKQAGLPATSYSEQAALSKMLLFGGDEDDDDDDGDVVAEQPRPAPEKTSLKKSLLLRKRTQSRPVPAPVPAPAPAPASAMPGRSVGIDLGTTFSAVSVIEGGRPVIIPVAGARIVPSVVAYTAAGDVLVGEAARRQYVVNPYNSFASVKRILGRTVREVKNAGESLSAHKIVTFKPVARRGGKAGGRRGRDGSDVPGMDGDVSLACAHAPGPLRPENVSALVIRALLDAAEAYLGGNNSTTRTTGGSNSGGTSNAFAKITRAVITVPAYFLPAQCEATTRAGHLAGLEKVKLLREPGASRAVKHPYLATI